MVGYYFGSPPKFNFRFEFDAQNRSVTLQRDGARATVAVDGKAMSLQRFAQRLRDGPAQVFYPELTLVYYSGECARVENLVARYRRHFQRIVRKPETDRYRPLFVQSSNEQSKVILLSLFAHGRRELLDRLSLEEIVDVRIDLRSPVGFDPQRHEPKLWNTEGAIRRIVAALDEASSSQEEPRSLETIGEDQIEQGARGSAHAHWQERTYYFAEGVRSGLSKLSQRLVASGDSVYLALEGLRSRGIFRSVSFGLKRKGEAQVFSFDQLSEGEKQLLAVVGAMTLTNQEDNLILLDEPDTHLNPNWSWDYPSMLAEAIKPEQHSRSTILMATHDPVIISGMVREQVLLARTDAEGGRQFSRPLRNPRGQGVANLLCSSEFFGLPSSLDKETQKLLDERLAISVKADLSAHDRARLKALNEQLEILPGVSERDPKYVAFLRQHQQDN